jgi:hypothetical protein
MPRRAGSASLGFDATRRLDALKFKKGMKDA